MNLLGFFEIALLYREGLSECGTLILLHPLCWGLHKRRGKGSPARGLIGRHFALEPLPILSFAFVAARVSGQVSPAIN
jgi:hypothetical protein